MKKKWIFAALLVVALLVLCVAIGGILYVTLSPVTHTGLSIIDNVQLTTQSVEAIEQKNFPVTGPAELILDNTMGDVTITAGDVSEIQVTARKTAWGSNQEQAQAEMDRLIVNMTQTGNQVTIKVEETERLDLNLATQANSVKFEIVVPAETTVDASTQSGNMSLTGTQGKAVLTSDFGDVSVFDYKGGLAATSHSGKVTAQRIQLLDTGFGDVSLQSDFGDVTLEEAVTQKVYAYSSSGNVRLNNVTTDGDVKLTTDFGDVSFRTGKAGTLTAETSSGSVSLEDLSVEGLVTAKSSFGDLDLVSAEALSYDLNTSSGSVTVNGASGTVKARSGFGDIDISNGSQATLDLETNNGHIEYFGSLGAGPHTLHTDFGDITLTMPSETAFDFDLQTNFGDIDSAYDVQISGEPDEKHWVGDVNGGGASLTASTDNGNVQLSIGD